MSRSPKAAARQVRRESRRNARNQKLLDQQGEITKAPVRPMEREIKPLTEAQTYYDAAMRSERIIFGVGPAGTGKTWFAAMRAAEALQRGEIEKIYITRPAVEAGENLGFLPGELADKYEPYLQPVRDAFEEKFGSGHLKYLLRERTIEPRPLAFMRGVTIKNAWLIADEMQNATRTQMKMLLTRIGQGAKFVINGDPRQIDLREGQSGLIDAMTRLLPIKGVACIEFRVSDVVRDDICQQIVSAYEN